MKIPKKVSILGTMYKISHKTVEEDINLEGHDGYCDTTTKQIVLRKLTKAEKVQPGLVGDLDYVDRSVLRHELIHAFFYESGHQDYCKDEILVDLLALQYPKLEAILGVVK